MSSLSIKIATLHQAAPSPRTSLHHRESWSQKLYQAPSLVPTGYLQCYLEFSENKLKKNCVSTKFNIKVTKSKTYHCPIVLAYPCPYCVSLTLPLPSQVSGRYFVSTHSLTICSLWSAVRWTVYGLAVLTFTLSLLELVCIERSSFHSPCTVSFFLLYLLKLSVEAFRLYSLTASFTVVSS